MAVKPIPDGYYTITPYLRVRGANELIAFLKNAFHAQETERITAPDGAIIHADMKIGDSLVMLSDVRGEWRPMPGAMYLYVADTDATYQRALQAGATSTMVPADQFYGDRSAGVKDSFGNEWWIATHIEDVSQAELTRRTEATTPQR